MCISTKQHRNKGVALPSGTTSLREEIAKAVEEYLKQKGGA